MVVGEHAYSVKVGSGLIGDVRGDALLSDSNVMALYGESIKTPARISVPAGEASKKMPVAENILEQLSKARIRRGATLVALGGGMITDLGGFVASIYQRGIQVVHVPTTLVAQVDAAVGGKTAVNLSEGKNLAGTFHQPKEVVADVDTLRSLPEREFRSGLAEVVKYGFALDLSVLETLENAQSQILNREPEILQDLVARCVEIKAGVVATDERDETGERMLLNYGHTFGHALEAASGYGRLLHGEAVAVGMMFAAALGLEAGLTDQATLDRQENLLRSLGLPVGADFDPAQVLDLLSADKKHSSVPRWVLLKAAGEAVVYSDIDEAAVVRVLERVGTA